MWKLRCPLPLMLDSMIDFSQPANVVAPLLLGCHLRHAGVTIRITETEAYTGKDDEGAHSFRGETASNRAMFGPPGHMYVYASYGIHRAGNIVCAPLGDGQGVLLRAGEVIDGLDIAIERRGNVPLARLAQGPGNLGKALDFHRRHNGSPITGPEFLLSFHDLKPTETILRGKRIGLTKNAEATLRFWIAGNPSVSSPRGPRSGTLFHLHDQ